MKQIVALATLAAATCLALPATAASDAECQEMWKKADSNSDGVLTDTEGLRYVAFMRIGDKLLATEGRISQVEFMEACKADTYKVAANDPGAPLKGSNSFTETQAKDRAAARGFVDISALTKDGDGIWRGTASQDGKPTSVAVDYKGNVVATAAP